MSKFRTVLTLAVVLMAALTMAACGGDATGGDNTTAPPETTAQTVSTTAAPTTQAPTTEAPVTNTTSAAQPTATSASAGQPTGDDGWKTVGTLKSDAAPWQDMPGVLVSDPFTVKGKARVVLDMPDTGELDGVILAIIPADQLTGPLTIIDAYREGTEFTLIPAYPVKEVDDLDGTYVMLNHIPAESPWTVELQIP